MAKKSLLIATLPWLGVSLSGEEYIYLTHLSENCSLENLPRLIKAEGLKQKLRDEKKWWVQAQGFIDGIEKLGVSYTLFNDPDYPKGFKLLENPPLILTYLGLPCWKSLQLLAVVGSRQPQAQTMIWLDEDLGHFLTTYDIATISGGARGVDQKVHQVSIRASCPTICFLPSGLGDMYPKSLINWHHHIIEQGGAVVSQFSPFQPMYKSQFHARNRLIAGLSDYMLIAEAKRKSGSLMTARIALDLGRPIGVLPCSPVGDTGQGGLDLIYDGAQMIRDYKDLYLSMGREGYCY